MPVELLVIVTRRLELLRIRNGLASGQVTCDPDVLPAALDWLDGEIEALKP